MLNHGKLAAWDRGGAASPPPFSPANIPNMMAWYDATDAASVMQSSSRISQLSDKSGNGNHMVQATAAEQPLYVPSGINGLPTIQFNDAGRNSRLAAPNSPSMIYTALTVFLVLRMDVDSSAETVMLSKYTVPSPTVARQILMVVQGNSSKKIAARIADSQATGNLNTAVLSDVVMPVLTPSIVQLTYDDSDRNIGLTLNAGPQQIATKTNPCNGNDVPPLCLGNRTDSVQSWPGLISECAMWTRRLSAPELAQMRAYLSGKYGIAA